MTPGISVVTRRPTRRKGKQLGLRITEERYAKLCRMAGNRTLTMVLNRLIDSAQEKCLDTSCKSAKPV